VIYRVLVLLFAIVLIAAGTERMCADVCSDPVADILDEQAIVHIAETAPPLVPSLIVTAAPSDRIAPAPVLMRVFRPPRTAHV
jgi:hypothetical protein